FHFLVDRDYVARNADGLPMDDERGFFWSSKPQDKGFESENDMSSSLGILEIYSPISEIELHSDGVRLDATNPI
ncbi:unnamed protein product, partial [Ilex paraguariensis]